MSGHDPLDVVRSGVEALRRGTSVAAPPPPAALPAPTRTSPEEPVTGDTTEVAPAPGSSTDSDSDAAAPAEPQPASDGTDDGGGAGSPERSPAQQRTGRAPHRRTRRTGPAPETAAVAVVEGGGEDSELPGFARGARRQIGVGLTEATFEALRSARGTTLSNGDVVLEALRRTHTELTDEFAPPAETSDDLFPTQPRRKRRLGIEGVRRMEFMCSPAEAAVIGELAQRCDLSLSSLIEEALRRYLQVTATS